MEREFSVLLCLHGINTLLHNSYVFLHLPTESTDHVLIPKAAVPLVL